MIKVIVVFGTRPEAIKLAPVTQALRACPTQFQTRVCATSQHREMLDQALPTFDLRPDDAILAYESRAAIPHRSF